MGLLNTFQVQIYATCCRAAVGSLGNHALGAAPQRMPGAPLVRLVPSPMMPSAPHQARLNLDVNMKQVMFIFAADRYVDR